jgi:hypothetical protein
MAEVDENKKVVFSITYRSTNLRKEVVERVIRDEFCLGNDYPIEGNSFYLGNTHLVQIRKVGNTGIVFECRQDLLEIVQGGLLQHMKNIEKVFARLEQLQKDLRVLAMESEKKIVSVRELGVRMLK